MTIPKKFVIFARMNITEILGDDWKKVETLMKETLSTDVEMLRRVNETVLSHEGKMLRPMTLLLVAKALGGATEDSVRFAAAAEILHNATLIHDDVADRADTRRGLPTVSSLVGASSAVLVGDFWLSKAVNCVVDSNHREKVVKYFSSTLCDLAEGEMLQLEKSRTLNTTLKDYYRIIYCKTASLFVASCVSGALSVDASDEQVEAARQYGEALGMAFQIKDDILDYIGTGELGKPVGLDIKERKITLPLIGVLDRGWPRYLLDRADRCPWKARKLRRYVCEKGGVEYASAKLEEFIQKACDALAVFPESRERECLEQIVRFNSIRTR